MKRVRPPRIGPERSIFPLRGLFHVIIHQTKGGFWAEEDGDWFVSIGESRTVQGLKRAVLRTLKNRQRDGSLQDQFGDAFPEVLWHRPSKRVQRLRRAEKRLLDRALKDRGPGIPWNVVLQEGALRDIGRAIHALRRAGRKGEPLFRIAAEAWDAIEDASYALFSRLGTKVPSHLDRRGPRPTYRSHFGKVGRHDLRARYNDLFALLIGHFRGLDRETRLAVLTGAREFIRATNGDRHLRGCGCGRDSARCRRSGPVVVGGGVARYN